MPQASQPARDDGTLKPSSDRGLGVAAPAILLASEGRPISPKAVATAAKLAIENKSTVHVLSIARIWGVAFGMQHPGLMPTSRELDVQREIVARAIRELEEQQVSATGEVLRSRTAAKSIAARGLKGPYAGIVMSADPQPHWLFCGLLWSHEPYRVRRFAKLPVYLVVDDPATPVP